VECLAIPESQVEAFHAASEPTWVRKFPIGWILPQGFIDLSADPKSLVQESAFGGRWSD